MIRKFFTLCISILVFSNTVLGKEEPVEEVLLLSEFLAGKSFLIKTYENQKNVYDYQIGLSALQKIRGSWQFKKSVRYSGLILSQTWQVAGGYDSLEAFEMLAQWLNKNIPGSKLLFECKGRSCGSSSQWASRVFETRLLYGRDGTQRYAVYKVSDLAGLFLVVYSSARSTNRQYIQTVLIRSQDN